MARRGNRRRSGVEPIGHDLRGVYPMTEVPIFRRTTFRHGRHMRPTGRRGRRGR